MIIPAPVTPGIEDMYSVSFWASIVSPLNLPQPPPVIRGFEKFSIEGAHGFNESWNAK